METQDIFPRQFLTNLDLHYHTSSFHRDGHTLSSQSVTSSSLPQNSIGPVLPTTPGTSSASSKDECDVSQWFDTTAYYGESSSVTESPVAAISNPTLGLILTPLTSNFAPHTPHLFSLVDIRGEPPQYRATESAPTVVADDIPTSSTSTQINDKIDPKNRVLTAHEKPIGSKRPRARVQYSFNVVYDFMWENVLQSQTRIFQVGPGKHGVKILDHFGGLASAKAHLSGSQMARKRASRAGLSSAQSRRERDKRRDFFCFMPGCGLCFERGDKLERHLIETSVHSTTKPWICPHHGCSKDYIRHGQLLLHLSNHVAAGHGVLPEPYPWNCPYPAVVEGLQRAYSEPATTSEDAGVGV